MTVLGRLLYDVINSTAAAQLVRRSSAPPPRSGRTRFRCSWWRALRLARPLYEL